MLRSLLASLLFSTASARPLPPGDEQIRPPAHARAHVAAPETLAQLDAGRAPVRVWWDVDSLGRYDGAVVEAQLKGRWKVVAEGAPGVRTRSLPRGSRVRVRWPGGVPTEPLIPDRGLGPPEVAALSGAGLPGRLVSDVAADEVGAWVALLEGGLGRVHAGHLEVEVWGRAQGLPAGQVNAVAAADGVAWVGTSEGLARIRGGRVDRIWTAADGLPDDWVQALRAIPDPVTPGAWVGTYQGLARLRGGGVEQVLTPWSVFSIQAGAAPGDLLVGYEGLRRVDGALVEGVDEALNVWDVDLFGPRAYLATDTEGVLRLEEGLLSPWWTPADGGVFSLARIGGVLYAAAGSEGLVAISDASGFMESWGAIDGLPGDAVYEVEAGPPGKLWVGTGDGLALTWPEQDVFVPWPLAPAAAGAAVYAVLGDDDYALLGTDDGVVALGDVPRGWRDVAAVPGPVLALARLGRSLWVLGPWDAWVVERGAIRRISLPAPAAVGAAAGGSFWIGGLGGLMRYDGALRRFVSVGDVGDVTAIAAAGEAIFATAGGRLVAMNPTGEQREYPQGGAPLALAASPEGIWLGTARGAALLDPRSGEVAPLEGLGAPVYGIAIAGGAAIAAVDGGPLVRLPSSLPLAGAAAAAEVGEVQDLTVDAAGRLWLMGDAGAFALPAAEIRSR